MVEHINTPAEFEEKVLKSEKTVLVDFFAVWCGPCKAMSPVIEQVAEKHPEIEVYKVDTDQNPQPAVNYGVMSIPTLIVFKNGVVMNQAVGSRPLAAVERLFEGI